jgi:hypothetical protein
MLPTFWHGMTSEEKHFVVDLVDRHGGMWLMPCLLELRNTTHIQLKDMQHLRVSYTLAKLHPEELEMGVPIPAEVAQKPDDVILAESQQLSLTHGLVSFQVVPKDIDGRPLFTGPALFDHLVGYARTHTSALIKLTPSSYLNVEMTKDQHIFLHPTAEDLTRGRIMQDAHSEGTLRFMKLWCEKNAF